MGVLNITPDSFSDDGLYFDTGKAVDGGMEMISQGADIIDIGGESSRPGSDPVSAEEEKKTGHSHNFAAAPQVGRLDFHRHDQGRRGRSGPGLRGRHHQRHFLPAL